MTAKRPGLTRGSERSEDVAADGVEDDVKGSCDDVFKACVP